MGLKEQLDAFVSTIRLNATPGTAPGSLITAGLTPDPLALGLLDEVAGLTRTTVLLKMLRFGDAGLPGPGTSIADFVAAAGQVLGGQAMPALSIEMPGPALPGARIPVKSLSGQGTGTGLNLNGLNVNEDVPALAAGSLPQQPALGKNADSGTAGAANDVLAGVPGIVGVVESGRTSLPLTVDLTWVFTVNDKSVTVADQPLAALTIVPPLAFVDLGSGTEARMDIGVTGTVKLTDPATGLMLSSAVNLSTSVQFPAIAIPRLLGLFTWPLYGAQPAQGRTDANQDSLLLMLPADSPLSGLDSVSATVGSVLKTVGPALALLNAPLPLGAVAPFGAPGDLTAQLTPVLSVLNTLAATLAKPSLDDYVPVTVIKATAPSDHSPTRGGCADLRPYIWHSWGVFGSGHDHYHDNAQSFLWLAPTGGQVVIYRGSGYHDDPDDPGPQSVSGELTLTTGGTCLAGIRDFRPGPGVIDPALSPPAVSPMSTADLVGRFTNETPPTDEGDWAWTNSVEFK